MNDPKNSEIVTLEVPVTPVLPTSALKVDNTINPKARDEYIAMCDHTTLKMVDGELQNVKLSKGDIFTAKEIPQVWINQNVAQRYAILKSEKDKFSNSELKKKGY